MWCGIMIVFFFSSRRRHTRFKCDWSSDVCSSDLIPSRFSQRCDVTTVQRWEKREGMPVHRHVHDKMGSVYASRVELEAWARGRNIRAADNGRAALQNESDVAPLVEPVPPKTAASTSRNWWTVAFPLGLVAAALR